LVSGHTAGAVWHVIIFIHIIVLVKHRRNIEPGALWHTLHRSSECHDVILSGK
jgi:hypothetical protein